jgi:hypothetical protein
MTLEPHIKLECILLLLLLLSFDTNYIIFRNYLFQFLFKKKCEGKR